MIERVKYAKPWLRREEAKVTGQFVHPRGSKWKPHQGKKEMDRRRRQMGLGEMTMDRANEIFTYKV